MYNYLTVKIRCPRCEREIATDAEFKFGLLDLTIYRLGDDIKWTDEKGKGLRDPKIIPEDGNYESLGYIECDVCGKDFFIDISVRGNIFSSIKLSDVKGYSETRPEDLGL